MKKPFYKKLWFYLASGLTTLSIISIFAVGLSALHSSSRIPAKEITFPTESTLIETQTFTAPSDDSPILTEETIDSRSVLTTSSTTADTIELETNYILNNNTKKFHLPSCASAAKIKDTNREDFFGTKSHLEAEGYSPCGHCKP